MTTYDVELAITDLTVDVESDCSIGSGGGGVLPYKKIFTVSDWHDFGTKKRLIIPANEHKFGYHIRIVTVQATDEIGKDEVNLGRKIYTNGDAALIADNAFNGVIFIEN